MELARMLKKPYVVAWVFVRGGSKGGKNGRLLAGKPLLGYAVEEARGSEWVDRVCVSTDDEELARVARKFGAEVPFIRPQHLATDSAAERLAWQHALQFLDDEGGPPVDVFASVPATCPLRVSQDVDEVIRTLWQGDAEIVVTAKKAHANPSFNMIKLDAQQHAQLVLPPPANVSRRQDAPPVYDLTAVAYAARLQFVREARTIFSGKVQAVVIPEERAVDIDTELDLQFAEFLLSRKGKQEKMAG